MKWKKKGLGLAWLAVMSLVSCGGLGLGSFGSDSSSDDPDDSTPSEGDEADATSGRMLISTSSAAVSSGSSALLLVPASEDDDSVTLAVPQSQTTTTVSAISVTASSLSRAPGAVVKNQTSGGISISSLDATTASPFASLTITGSGFDPEEAVVAVLFIPTGNGIPVAVPVNAGEADTLTVSVPPYMDATTGAYSSGAVGVQVVQIDGETVNTSNLKSGLTISELPTLASTVPTGVMTLSYLSSMINVLTTATTEALATASISEAASTMNTVTQNLEDLKTKFEAFYNGTASTVTTGSVTLTSSDIATLDRVIRGYLVQTNNALSEVDSSVESTEASLSALTACPSLYGDYLTDQILCQRQQYGEELQEKGWQGLKIGFQIEFAAWSSVFAGIAAAEAAAAGVSAATITGLQALWQAASGHISAYVTASPPPSVQDTLSGPTAIVIDEVLSTGGLLGVMVDVYNNSKAYDAIVGDLNATAETIAEEKGITEDQADLAIHLAQRANANGELILVEAEDRADAIAAAGESDSEDSASVTGITFTSVGGTTAARITPVLSGVTVQYTVSGTDGYYDSGSLQTNAAGQVSFGIPSGASGVTDTITVSAVLSGYLVRTTYTW